jgi:hypothetical protein
MGQFDDLIPTNTARRGVETAAVGGGLFDDLVPNKGNASLDRTPTVPKASEPEKRQGWLAWVQDLVSGKDRTEFPDAPELNLGQAGNISLDDAQAGKSPDYDPTVISRSSITSDPAAQLDILRKQIPGLESKQDKHGNAMVKLPGQKDWAYLNKPGASWRDLDEVGTQTMASLPFLGVAGSGATIPARMASALGFGGLASMSNDAMAVAAGSEQGIDPIKAGVAGGLTAAFAPGVPTAAAGLVREGYRAATAPIRHQVEKVINPEEAASRAILAAREADKGRTPVFTPAERERLEAYGFDFRNMDEGGGQNTQALARSAANVSPEARQTLLDVVEPRYEQQANRGVSMLQNQVPNPALASMTREQLKAEAQKARSPYYNVAYKEGEGGILDDTILGLTDAPAVQDAMRQANTSVANRRAGGVTRDPTKPVTSDDIETMREGVATSPSKVGHMRLYRVDGANGAGTTYMVSPQRAAELANETHGGKVMFVDVPPGAQGRLRALNEENFQVPDEVAQRAAPFRSGEAKPTRDTAEVNALIDMWKFVNEQRQQPRPESLTAFLARNRGIVDDGGDLAQIQDKATRPGLARRDTRADGDGLFGAAKSEIDNDLDGAALRAWEAGFFPEHQARPTRQDLLDALDDEARGMPRYRAEDAEAAEAFNIADEASRDLTEAGIPSTARGWSPERIREHLNDASLPQKGMDKPTLEYWDLVKRKLDELIDKAEADQQPSKVMELEMLRKKLVARLDAAVPVYSDARGVAETFFKANDSLTAGEKFVTMPLRDTDEHVIKQALDKMSKKERDLFAEGFISKYTQVLNSTADRNNLLNVINNSNAARKRVELALGPNGAREVELYVRTENLFDNVRRGLQNSTTVRQWVELGLASGVGAVAGGGNIGDPHGWMAALITLGASRGKLKISQRVANEVAKKLVSSDPVTLRKGVQQAANSNVLHAIRAADDAISGMVRNVAAQQAVGDDNDLPPQPEVSRRVSAAPSQEPPQRISDIRTGFRDRYTSSDRVSSNVENQTPAPEFSGMSDDKLLQQYNDLGRQRSDPSKAAAAKAAQSKLLLEFNRRGLIQITDPSASAR